MKHSAIPTLPNRRHFLQDSCCGFGSLAMASLLQSERAVGASGNPLSPKPRHLPESPVKSVIFLFMAGGPSHVDTFDPKPLLNKLDGKPRPESFGDVKYQFVRKDARLLGSKRKFTPRGESGVPVSDLFAKTGEFIDDIAVIRSCYGDKVVHSAAQYELFSGRTFPGFPSLGSWVVYGLGNESESMPAYVVMPDPDGALEGGQPMYANGFLPAVYQPAMFGGGPQPVRNLGLPEGISLDERRQTVELIRSLNEANLTAGDDELAARINAYELAFKMQTDAPEIFDVTGETKETLDLYGVGVEPTDDYARRCLLARRLVEQGVRFVTVVSGGGPGNKQWDAHADVEENHLRLAGEVDQPIAALLKDLKRRGLLESTLIVWGGEFGRSPEAQGGKGRDHHNTAFSMWLAGGGVKGGQAIGATDEIGLKSVEKPYHLRDVHATILHLIGLDQDELSYQHQGRRERLPLVEGEIIEEVV
ncbi:MAG: DUF1501 domain-containing protein [Planctomycetaceae bacterium]|nr:DUF1501 domain-containing protein [Planctomycetaceae bacterium]MBT6483777.1 DUF1501 domain-containing protein [Planctomycetaceae bacterium]MBT6498185.1 DUF1501 domain-containing protein [Planctomycetaceae bacterium]